MSKNKTLKLSVNIDHIATLRQARRSAYPDPVDAAAIAEQAGADGITVHLRGDRRHIQDDDIRRLRPMVRGKLNLEIAATDEMLRLAGILRPEQVTLVPERPEEITTEGGLDIARHGDLVRDAAERLQESGILVSVFLDPDAAQLDALATLGPLLVPGFEINTDAYTRAVGAAAEAEAAKTADIARAGAAHGFHVYAGHGLTTDNVGKIAAMGEIEELNIGHWLVSRAALVGMRLAVEEMLAAMQAAR